MRLCPQFYGSVVGVFSGDMGKVFLLKGCSSSPWMDPICLVSPLVCLDPQCPHI